MPRPDVKGVLLDLKGASGAGWNVKLFIAMLEKDLRQLADDRTVKAAILIHGTRLAITGRMVSPGLFEMLVILGRETVLRRIDRLAETL